MASPVSRLWFPTMSASRAAMSLIRLLEQPQRVQAVDRADERRMDAVADHALNVRRDSAGHVARNRQGVGLHRSQARCAVWGVGGGPGALGGVGPAAVPQRSDEEYARAGGHHDGPLGIVRAGRTGGPAVAAGE